MFARICDVCDKQIRMGKKDKGLAYAVEVTLTKGKNCIAHIETHLCSSCMSKFHLVLKEDVDNEVG